MKPRRIAGFDGSDVEWLEEPHDVHSGRDQVAPPEEELSHMLVREALAATMLTDAGIKPNIDDSSKKLRNEGKAEDHRQYGR